MPNNIPKPIKKEQSNEVVEFKSKRAPKKPIDLEANNAKTKKFKSKRNNDETKDESKSSDEGEENVMSLKQAKFDVFKYGIKGFDKEAQQNAKMQLAMKLGAAPPKNEYINYKELLKRKQDEKTRREELLKENRSFEAKVLAQKGVLTKKRKQQSASARRKSKINRGHVGQIKGQIGSFSNGVLKINKHQLKKIKLNKSK